MNADKHTAAARTLRRLAGETDVSLHLAAERDDPLATMRHLEERNLLLDLAIWHEEQAAAKRLAAVEVAPAIS